MSSQARDNDRPTYVRLTVDQRRALNELAKQENRTLSGEIRHAVDRHLAAQTSQDRAALR